MRKLKLAGYLLVFAAIAGLSGCGDNKAAVPPAGPPPVEVTVVTAEPRDLPAVFEYVGQIAGIREVEVRARISGILQSWNYKEGSKVEAGQSLFTIDPEPFRAALAKAEADLASAEASQSQASKNLSRLKPLWEAKAVSQKDFDDAVSAEQVASANMKSAQAALTQARLDLSYTRVEAPISGITSRALKSEGSLVQAQQTLLTTIAQIDPLYVIFSFTEAENLKFTRAVNEKRLSLPKDGKFDVVVKLADGRNYAHAGKVDFTNVSVNPNTGTIEARGIIPNPDRMLRPGQFVRVLLSGATRLSAITVPQRSVLEGPNTKIVMTVNAQSVVEQRLVEVGDWTGEEWVITKGLNPGDRVIVDGVVKARPGSPVKIVPAAVPGQPAPAQPDKSSPAAK